jgi:hypothetical protein
MLPEHPSSFREAVVGTRVSQPGPAERAWLGDETAIDFPSVAAEVDAMTSAFVAPDTVPTLTADVRLTAHQAFAGAALPIEVPVRCTCRACGGRGEQWPDICPSCEGSGIELRPHAVRVLVPARVRDGARFRFVVSPRQHPETRIELRVSVA